MTGYGIAYMEIEKAKYTVEIKSLNSKFLELNLKLPRTFSDKELFLRNECTRLIERGKVNVTATVEYIDVAERPSRLNTALLQAYYKQLKELAFKFNDTPDNLLQVAVTLPDVITYDEELANDEEWAALSGAFFAAVTKFNQFRADEGGVLKADLAMRSKKLVELLTEVESRETNRIPLIRERISQYLDAAVGRENVDMNRFEQELIFYIDKLDITEEKVRLRSHCNYFLEALEDSNANGKKLGFISQEMGREINTLGSKANDAGIQQTVILMKEELEKIKEQLLNVL
ncbi:TIGR00255 family protein [bacterium A37T11]|nr:TIGR00255 family protein [bacterium A37T11]